MFCFVEIIWVIVYVNFFFKDPATEIKPEQETEPVCDISAPSPEVSEAAETNPTDEAATSQDTPTVTLDTPPVPTQTENSMKSKKSVFLLYRCSHYLLFFFFTMKLCFCRLCSDGTGRVISKFLQTALYFWPLRD